MCSLRRKRFTSFILSLLALTFSAISRRCFPLMFFEASLFISTCFTTFVPRDFSHHSSLLTLIDFFVQVSRCGLLSIYTQCFWALSQGVTAASVVALSHASGKLPPIVCCSCCGQGFRGGHRQTYPLHCGILRESRRPSVRQDYSSVHVFSRQRGNDATYSVAVASSLEFVLVLPPS